jgi:hypothetical protein
MSLSILSFVNFKYITEANLAKYLGDIVPGTIIYYAGRELQAVEQTSLGWTFKVLRGKILRPSGTPQLFTWDSDIYQQERYRPKESDKLIPIPAKQAFQRKGSKDTIIKIPEKYQTPQGAWEHAKYDIGTEWPDGEYYIMQSPKYATFYATKLTHKRFWKAESTIATAPEWAQRYAKEFGLIYNAQLKRFE